MKRFTLLLLTVLFAFSTLAFAQVSDAEAHLIELGKKYLELQKKKQKSNTSKIFKATYEAAKLLAEDDSTAYKFAKVIYNSYSDVHTRSRVIKKATSAYREMLEAAAVAAAHNYVEEYDGPKSKMDGTALLVIQDPSKLSSAELEKAMTRWGRRFYVYNAGSSKAVSEMEKWLEKIEKAESEAGKSKKK